MLNLVLDTAAAEAMMVRMQLQIRDVGHQDIPAELEAWQVEDMHRQFPNVKSDQQYVSWFTRIWPRSRTYDLTHAARPLAKRLAQRRPTRSLPRVAAGSHRPILRPMLYDKLRDRMAQMLIEKLGWTTAKGAGPVVSVMGPRASQRASMIGSPAITTATAAQPGPRMLARQAKLNVAPIPVGAAAKPGPKMLARQAKLNAQTVAGASRAQPGPRMLARQARLRP